MNGDSHDRVTQDRSTTQIKSKATASFDVCAGKGVIKAHQLYDSTVPYLNHDTAMLRDRLKRDGYLFLRGAIPSESVREAYQHLIKELQAWHPTSFVIENDKLRPDPSHSNVKAGLLGRQDLAHSPQVLKVLESPVLASLAADLQRVSFGRFLRLVQDACVKTTTFKWLRAVPHGGFTGLHTDRVFLGQNSDCLLTMWLPLHNIGPPQGSMLLCSGSHRSRAFAGIRQTYGLTKVGSDGTASGWLTDDGARLGSILKSAHRNGCGIDWRTAIFQPGDVLVLDQDTLHMTARNGCDSFRISCDTRWQPASEPANSALGSWKTIVSNN